MEGGIVTKVRRWTKNPHYESRAGAKETSHVEPHVHRKNFSSIGPGGARLHPIFSSPSPYPPHSSFSLFLISSDQFFSSMLSSCTSQGCLSGMVVNGGHEDRERREGGRGVTVHNCHHSVERLSDRCRTQPSPTCLSDETSC